MSDATTGAMRALTSVIIYFCSVEANLIVLFAVRALVSAFASVKSVSGRSQAYFLLHPLAPLTTSRLVYVCGAYVPWTLWVSGRRSLSHNRLFIQGLLK